MEAALKAKTEQPKLIHEPDDKGKQIEDLFLILVSSNQDKVYMTCYISKNLVDDSKMNANNIVKDLSQFIDGSGGGQSFFANASGTNLNGIPKLKEEAEKLF